MTDADPPTRTAEDRPVVVHSDQQQPDRPGGPTDPVNADPATTEEPESRDTGDVHSFLRRATFIAALGGFLFGYDTGVISGALIYIAPAFDLSSSGQQVVVSSLLLGAVLGAFLAGPIADRVGRRTSLLVAAGIFAVGALASAVAPSVAVLVGARFCLGVAIGASSLVVPLYLAEIAPKETRGKLVSRNQLLITVGILASYLVGYALADAEAWRWMLGLAAVPAVVMLIGLVRLPESPRWLLAKGRDAEAREVLQRTRPAQEAEDEADEMAEQNQEQQASKYRDLLAPELRPALRIGIGIAVANQMVGVNAIIYYTPTILKQTGFGSSAAILGSVGVGLVNMIVTFVALSMIDRVGRRPLVLTGVAVLTAALAVLGLLYVLPSQQGVVGLLIVAGLCVYIAAFAASLGIGIWLFNSEVYPTAVRGRASSLGTLTHWGLDFIISATVLTLISTITTSGMFWLFGAFGLASWLFLRRYLPETKNRSLEDIDAQLREQATG